ncbi:hypothetical protein ScPMuIL_005975 [Solemya velum]
MWNKIGFILAVSLLVGYILCEGRHCYYLLGEVNARLCFDCPAGFYRYNGQCHRCHNDCSTFLKYRESSDSEKDSRSKFCDSPSDECYGCQKGYYRQSTCDLQCDDRCDSNGCEYYSGNCFRCNDGYWGDTCSSICSVGCSGSRCDQVTGDCDVCKRGWTGDKCGVECLSNCDDQGCDKTSGICVACELGCAQTLGECVNCVVGWYGNYCTNYCPSACDDRGCYKTSGYCYGCKTGWTGPRCDTRLCTGHCLDDTCDDSGRCINCSHGYWGLQCSEKCDTHCGDGGCDRKTAVCTGCDTGRHGIRCQDVCVQNCVGGCGQYDAVCNDCGDGFFGDFCNLACNFNCNFKSCSRNGTCTDGCADRWTGQMCDSPCGIEHCSRCRESGETVGCVQCDSPYTGSDCSRQCPENCESCTSLSECTECKTGFHGVTCDEICSDHCIECTSGTDCGRCEDGWYTTALGYNKHGCGPCSEGCMNCTSGTACRECYSGWFYLNYKCFECSSHCLMCSDAALCQRCELGWYVDITPSGRQCATCPIHCTDCDSMDDCTTCQDGWTGPRCQCSENCDGGLQGCDQNTGRCTTGCVENYYGDSCDVQCDACLTCSQSTGVCTSCRHGYFGLLCNETCSSGCSESPDGEVHCDIKTGRCLTPCVTGYSGDTCSVLADMEGNNGSVDDGVGVGVGVGVAVGVLVLIAAVVLLFLVLRRRRRRSSSGSNKKSDLPLVTSTHVTDGTANPTFAEEEDVEAFQPLARVTGGDMTSVSETDVLAAGPVMLRDGMRTYQRENSKILARWTDYLGYWRDPYPGRLGKITRASLEAPLGQPPSVIQIEEQPSSVVLVEEQLTPVVTSPPNVEYCNISQSKPIDVDKLMDHVLKMKAGKNAFAKEHEDSQYCIGLPKELVESYEEAGKVGNRGKCRYRSIYPYDHSRVVLDLEESKPDSDFINACYVDGYDRDKAYVAAQGPVDHTLKDFWRMVWQLDSGIIVMLTNLTECGQMKCVQYWPNPGAPHTYGSVASRLIEEEEFADFTVRTLGIRKKVSNPERIIKQFHFTTWPDKGVPKTVTALIDFRNKVCSTRVSGQGPYIVHCSAGIGRTGTFIGLDYLISQGQGEKRVDVFNVICKMRHQRTHLVQTHEQYEFLYDALVEALHASNSMVPSSDFHKYYLALKETVPGSDITGLQQQFQTIQRLSNSNSKSDYETANQPDNKQKNRYSNILAADSYRVILSNDAEGNNSYINAVFLPGYKQKRGYILTEAPQPNTVTDFWKMIYEESCSSIVMMNNKNKKDKSMGEYMPSGEKGKATYGPFALEVKEKAEMHNCTVTTVNLSCKNKKKQAPRTIKRFEFKSWPQNLAVPESPASVLHLMDAVLAWQRQIKNPPIVVHCMNGAERSGLFCAICHVIDRLKIQQEVHLMETVMLLKAIRQQLVHSEEQYVFCHEAVRGFLEEFNTYSNFS